MTNIVKSTYYHGIVWHTTLVAGGIRTAQPVYSAGDGSLMARAEIR